MKLTLREAMGLGQALSHTGARGKVTATVSKHRGDRYVSIGKQRWNVSRDDSLDDSLGDHGDEDGFVLDVEAARIEELVKKHGVTHVVDVEAFGDDTEHPVSEYFGW